MDAIGHPGTVVVLVGIAADDLGASVRARDVALAPARYGAAPGAFPSLHDVRHAAPFGSPDALPVI